MKMAESFTNMPIYSMLSGWKNEGLDETVARKSFYNLVDIIDADPNSAERVYHFYDITGVIKKANEKNNDINEFIQLCDFYSDCVKIGPNNVNINLKVVNNLCNADLIHVLDSYAPVNSLLGKKVSMTDVGFLFNGLISYKDDQMLFDLLDHCNNYHKHDFFLESIIRLKQANKSGRDRIVSYLSKYPSFMQPRSKFQSDFDYNVHHSFDLIKYFINHYEKHIQGDLKYKLNCEDMFLIDETKELVDNLLVIQHKFLPDQRKYISKNNPVFFQHLNESISYGETLEEKRQSMSHWCREVQRMVKSGSYDDELRLMFGGVVR